MTRQKQKAESIFRSSIRALGLFYLKLQVMPLAYHQLPADYLVLGKTRRYLIECKECNLIKGNQRFDFVRLTQLQDLIAFVGAPGENEAYVFLYFRANRVRQSYAFLLPLDQVCSLIAQEQKSINLTQLRTDFSRFQLQAVPGSRFACADWFI